MSDRPDPDPRRQQDRESSRADEGRDPDPRNRHSPGDTAEARGAAWDQFYAYCSSLIRSCPSVRRLSEVDREDCRQEVLVEVVRRVRGGGPEALSDDFPRWVRTVSRNKAVDIVRRKFRRPEVGFSDGSGETVADAGRHDRAPEVDRGETVSLVWEALLALDQQVPVTSYLVFYLRTIEGWDVPEVAALFQISPEQARVRCHRVRKKFEAALRSRGLGDGGRSQAS